MKNVFFAVALLLVGVIGAEAQATLTSTTLSAAITDTRANRTFTVASATGFSAGRIAFVDGEAISILSVSGTQIKGIGGYSGTRAAVHASGARVYVGPASYFSTYDRVGPCTSTSEVVLPVANVRSGKVFDCVSSIWRLIFDNGQAPSHFDRLTYPTVTVTNKTSAGDVTLTAAEILGGLITRDPAGAARTDTLPTAALLVAAIPGATVGTSFEFTIRNTADAAETITVASGSGGTDSGTMTIAQNNSKRFLVRITDVTLASENYTLYSLGTIVH